MEAIRKLDRRNIKLAIAFLALNVLDGILTQILMSRGGYEVNPIMREILEGQKAWAFWTFKVGATLGSIFLLFWLADRFPRQIHRIFVILVGAMLGVCLVNAIGVI